MTQHSHASFAPRWGKVQIGGVSLPGAPGKVLAETSAKPVKSEKDGSQIKAEMHAAVAERREKVKQMVSAGHTSAEIKDAFGITCSQLSGDLKALGMRMLVTIPQKARHKGKKHRNTGALERHRLSVNERRAQLLKRIDQGQSSDQIMLEMNMSYDTLNNDCAAIGRRALTAKEIATNARKKRVRELHAEGYTNAQMAVLIGCGYTTIQRHLADMKLVRNEGKGVGK